jgi:DNA repair protein RecN (Recombination protein N)
MISSLHIKDFIFIEEEEIEFDLGFSVITGETGAGKSILLDAIMFVLGHKFPKDPVRVGTQKCVVAITLLIRDPELLTLLHDQEIEADNNELIIRRIQNTSGKRKIFINDQPVSQAIISKITEKYIELHAQHSQVALLNTSSHIDLLDQYGKLYQETQHLKNLYQQLCALKKQLSDARKNFEALEKEEEYLLHNFAELRDANLEKDEEEELHSKRHILKGKQKEMDLLQSIADDVRNFSIETCVINLQKTITRSINTKLVEDVQDILEILHDNIATLQDLIRSEMVQLSREDENTLFIIEERLALLKNLARKHQCTVSDLPIVYNQIIDKISLFENSENSIKLLENEYLELEKKYFDFARHLSEKRSIYAKAMQDAVKTELGSLCMEKAEFAVILKANEDQAGANGIDKVEFWVSTNPGMKLMPIEQVASGGELSRLILAIKVVISNNLQNDIESDNRPLSKLAPADKVQGVYGAEDHSVLKVREDMSTETTQQFTDGVEFGKRSNIEKCCIAGHGVKYVYEYIKTLPITILPRFPFPSSIHLGRYAYFLIKNNRISDVHKIEPFYIRPPDAKIQ